MPSSPPASTRCSPLRASGTSPRRSGLLVRTRPPGVPQPDVGVPSPSARNGPQLILRSLQRTSSFSLPWTADLLAAEKKPLRIGDPDPVQLRRRDKLGGLVHEYRLVA